MAMELTHRIQGKTCIVEVRGDLKEKKARSFYAQILKIVQEHKIKAILINLQKVEFITSGGLGVLLGLCKRLKGQKIKIGLCESNETVFNVFHMVCLDRKAEIYPTEQTALKDFNR